MPLEKIQEILQQAMGLHAATVGSTRIMQAITERMKANKLNNIDTYLEKINTDKNELKELIEEVVVPETWFFRDSEPFKMMVKFVKDEWLKNEPDGPLRILSMPCATGEEPYSIAMALIDAGLTPSQIYIDGVDISQRNINRCKEASYREHSFRGVDPFTKDRFFRLRDDNCYHPDILIRAMVNFSQASILNPDYINRQRPYDIVFCRNLLIYFDDKTQGLAINMLGKLLKPTGMLFVGHVETGRFLNNINWNISLRYPKAFALRKFRDDIKNIKDHNTSSHIQKNNVRNFSATKHKPARKTNTIKTPIATYDNEQRNRTNLAKNKVTIKGKTALLPDMEHAKLLADQGKFTEAESICLDSLEMNKQDAKAYFLLALIQLATGDEQKSAQYFRNVIYLEPRNIEALMYLATLTEQQGDPKQAQKLTERALRCQQHNQQKVQQ